MGSMRISKPRKRVPIRKIRDLLVLNYSYRDIQQELHVSPKTISRINKDLKKNPIASALSAFSENPNPDNSFLVSGRELKAMADHSARQVREAQQTLPMQALAAVAVGTAARPWIEGFFKKKPAAKVDKPIDTIVLDEPQPSDAIERLLRTKNQ